MAGAGRSPVGSARVQADMRDRHIAPVSLKQQAEALRLELDLAWSSARRTPGIRKTEMTRRIPFLARPAPETKEEPRLASFSTFQTA